MDNQTNRIERIETGKWVIAATVKGGFVFGQVLLQGEVFTQEQGIQKFYRIGIVGSRWIDLYESEIFSLKVWKYEDAVEYLEELEEKYGIQCFDEKTDKYVGNSSLLGKVIYNGVWEKFSKDEKKRFVKNVSLQNDEIIEILDVLISNKNQVRKVHDEKIKALEAQLESLKKWEKLAEKSDWTKRDYDALVKGLLS